MKLKLTRLGISGLLNFSAITQGLHVRHQVVKGRPLASDPSLDVALIQVAFKDRVSEFTVPFKDTMRNCVETIMRLPLKVPHPNGTWRLVMPPAPGFYDPNSVIGDKKLKAGQVLVIEPGSDPYLVTDRKLAVVDYQNLETLEGKVELSWDTPVKEVFPLHRQLRLVLWMENSEIKVHALVQNLPHEFIVSTLDEFSYLYHELHQYFIPIDEGQTSSAKSRSLSNVADPSSSDSNVMAVHIPRKHQILFLTPDGLWIEQPEYRYVVDYIDFFQERVDVCAQMVPIELGNSVKSMVQGQDQAEVTKAKEMLSKWNAPECVKHKDGSSAAQVSPGPVALHSGIDSTPAVPPAEAPPASQPPASQPPASSPTASQPSPLESGAASMPHSHTPEISSTASQPAQTPLASSPASAIPSLTPNEAPTSQPPEVQQSTPASVGSPAPNMDITSQPGNPAGP